MHDLYEGSERKESERSTRLVFFLCRHILLGTHLLSYRTFMGGTDAKSM